MDLKQFKKYLAPLIAHRSSINLPAPRHLNALYDSRDIKLLVDVPRKINLSKNWARSALIGMPKTSLNTRLLTVKSNMILEKRQHFLKLCCARKLWSKHFDIH